MKRIAFQFLVLFLFVLNIHCQNPEVKIPQGWLRGTTRENWDGGKYHSFQKIPYAKPPVNELRFKNPQPSDGWDGIRDATKDLPLCRQIPLPILGKEDCLYLNVYTPLLPSENVTQLPVMVWIPGGGFTKGSGSQSMYGPKFLLTKDIVLVSINYRLGIFGFLSLDDPNLGVTGNAGLKDQVLALKWVRDNIKYFGGDPNNVLIFGGSAGAMSVQLLLMSPMAKGLFHKTIAQSGDALTEYLVPLARNNAVATAKMLDIQTENWEEMVKSLQKISSIKLIAAQMRGNTEYFYPLFAGPVVEIPSSNGPTFLEKSPIDIIKSGTYNQVPSIIGYNDNEALIFQLASRIFERQNLLITDFTQYVPSEFNITKGSRLEKEISEDIKRFYYGETEPSTDNITRAVDLITDAIFAFSSYRTVRESLSTAKNPIYFYRFSAKTELNILGKLDKTIKEYPGAAHVDNIGYLFNNLFTPDITPGSVEDRGIRNMVNLMTNFAIHGDPTPDHSSNNLWEPVTQNQFKHLHIGTEESYLVDSVFTPDRMEFWWNLFEKYTKK